jgi:anti-sigma factor RsiW
MIEPVAHETAPELFGALLDGEISTSQEEGLRAHLSGCVECRTGFDRYERAISLVREVGREHAPEGFATTILRRVRRRRRLSHFNGARLLEVTSTPAAEVMIPVLIAAAVAALIIFAAP